MRKLTVVIILALVLLMAVTPVLAAGSGSQAQHQNQEGEKNQNQPQNQEQNGGQPQNQEKNVEQNQNQEQNQHQLGEGGNDESLQTSALSGKQLFTLTGTIADLETEVSITVALHNGNRFIKRLVEDEQLLVVVTEATEYRQYTGGTCIPAEFSDLLPGDTVHIKGMVSVDEGIVTFTATRVTVDVPCLPTPI